MRDLFLIGVHESGEYVVLGSDEGGDEYRLPLDDAFREAARWDKGFDTEHKESPVLRPAEVQALIRGGASAAEAAQRAGWTVEKVRRFEGPVLAERGHIAELAGHAHVRGHSFGQGVELRRLVEERLAERDIDPAMPRWDSRRGDDGQWIVEVRFPAEHQAHVAQWRFSRSTMTVAALNDHARAITDDDEPAAQAESASESGGGSGTVRTQSPGRNTGSSYRDYSDAGSDGESGDDDLVADLRERAAARIRRRGARAASSGVTRVAAVPAIMDETGAPEAPRAIHADEELPFDAVVTRDDAPEAERTAQEATAPAQTAQTASVGDSEADPEKEPEAAQNPEAAAVAEAAQSAEDEKDATVEGKADTEQTDAAQADAEQAVVPEPAAPEPAHVEPELDLDVPSAAIVSSSPAPSTESAAEGAAANASSDEPRADAATVDAPATVETTESAPEQPKQGEQGAEKPAAPAPKPAPRKRAPRATPAKRTAASRGRATSGAASGSPARQKPSPGTSESEPAPSTSAKPARTPRAASGGANPNRTSTGRSGASGAGSAFSKQPGAGQSTGSGAQPTQPRQPRGKSGAKGRASVPAWDDIMFGAKPGGD